MLNLSGSPIRLGHAKRLRAYWRTWLRSGWLKQQSLRFALPGGNPESLHAIDAVLHIGDSIGGEFHADLWLAHLEGAGARVLVVARSRIPFDILARRGDVAAAYVRDGRDAEMLIARCPSLRAVFYSSNTGNSIHFIRANHLTHVFLGHGDSDKSASSHKFFRVYDEIWTAGQAHIDRLLGAGIGIDPARFHIVGRPALKALLGRSADRASARRFLYLPTWEGFYAAQNYTSLPIAAELIRAAVDVTDRTAVVKLHPWTGKQEIQFTRSENAIRLASIKHAPVVVEPRTRPAAELMADADFLISDVSSVVNDFLITGRPIFVFLPRERDIRVVLSRTLLQDYAYVFSDVGELKTLLKEVIVQGRDELAGQRQDALRYVVGVDELARGTFAEQVRRVVDPVAREKSSALDRGQSV